MHTGLAGKQIVVTRPVGQATHLAEALVAEGAHPILFPVLAIHPLQDRQALLGTLPRLDQYDLAIFISPNAAQHGLREVLAHRRWPANLKVATVGGSSAQVIAAHDLGGNEQRIIQPLDRFDSEALLALPELQHMQGQRVLIFRGDGGREVLADTLRTRGASVDYLTCYTRGMPDTDPQPLLRRWEAGTVDAVTLTSSEGLLNLLQLIGRVGHAWLAKTPVFVPHARIAETARTHGLHQVIETPPADAGLLAGLLRYFNDNTDLR